MSRARGLPPDTPACEGRAWWLELQRQRAAQARQRSGTPTATDAGPLAAPLPWREGISPAQTHQSGPAYRRFSSLLRSSRALLQRMSRHEAGSGSQPLEPMAHPQLQQQQQVALAPAAGLEEQGATSSQNGWMKADSFDEHHLAHLLEGGLIGKATAASVAWHAMQQQQAQAEQQEWQLRRQQEAEKWRSIGHASTSSGGSSWLGSKVARPALVAAAEEGGEAGAGGEWGTGDNAPPQPSLPPHVSQAAAAGFQLAEFTDSEVRHHIARLLAGGGGCARRGPAPPTRVSPHGGADPASPPGAQPSSLSASRLLDHRSVEATAGSDAGLGSADPLLVAWMVTRSPPDFRVRGYKPPPTRTACRLVAAKEMIQYYRRQEHTQGCYFQHLHLSNVQAGGRESEGAPLELLAKEEDVGHTGQQLRRSLRTAVRKSMVVGLVQEMAAQSKAVVWAREHCQQVAAAAEEQLMARKEEAVAAGTAREAAAAAAAGTAREAAAAAAAGTAREAAAAAAAVAAARHSQQGPHVGDAFAAVVQQAKRNSTMSAADGAGSSPGNRRCSMLPPVQLQKLTQHWQQSAAAMAGAVGEHTARERQRVASQQQLREQWEAVRQRLPGTVAVVLPPPVAAAEPAAESEDVQAQESTVCSL